jgi:hypothetical protein
MGSWRIILYSKKVFPQNRRPGYWVIEHNPEGPAGNLLGPGWGLEN